MQDLSIVFSEKPVFLLTYLVADRDEEVLSSAVDAAQHDLQLLGIDAGWVAVHVCTAVRTLGDGCLVDRAARLTRAAAVDHSLCPFIRSEDRLSQRGAARSASRSPDDGSFLQHNPPKVLTRELH